MTEPTKSVVKIDGKDVAYVVLKEFPEKPYSNFYVLNALFEYVFYRTKQRAVAQKASDEMYGKGKYTIRTCGF